MRQAVDVGVDGIEHCSCLTPADPTVRDELFASLVAGGIIIGGAHLGSPAAATLHNAPALIRSVLTERGTSSEAGEVTGA